MGEGFTPIVPLDGTGSSIFVKLDYLMPTLSFKDRGAAVLVAKAKEIGVTKLVADSSGNAGTSIAAYANRAGIECHIYVPESTSPKKIQQIVRHGATVHTVPGSRENTAKAAQRAVNEDDVFYASHVYNPYFYQGTKTYAFEVFEQMKEEIPDVVVVPVGNGTLLLGVYYGFKELLDLGLINRMPRILAIQAEGCAPLALAFDNGLATARPVINEGTAAEGIAIANPPRSSQILAAVRETDGVIVTAPESLIDSTRDYLAKKGFYVEPTTAATFAGFFKYVESCIQGRALEKDRLFKVDPFQPGSDRKVVIPLCGAGIKAD
nr:threonine synthase [Virgibacillus phasianinus]